MARAATTTDVFNAMGDVTRRRIIDELAVGESTVGELVDVLSVPQPQLSKHLKVLRDVDVVRCRRSGRQRIYRVHAEALRPMQSWLQQLTVQINAQYDRLDDYLVERQRIIANDKET
jgi:DNA-binding transcriptional ArsR family regulator